MKFLYKDADTSDLHIGWWFGEIIISISKDFEERKKLLISKKYIAGASLYAVVTGYDIDNFVKMALCRVEPYIETNLGKNSRGKAIAIYCPDAELKASFVQTLMKFGWLGRMKMVNDPETMWSLVNNIKDYNEKLSGDSICTLADENVEDQFNTISCIFDSDDGTMYIDHVNNVAGCISRDLLDGPDAPKVKIKAKKK